MSEPNYAGNIIVNLSSLPDFLRKPILKKRMIEYFSMTEQEKNEIVVNALNAGPTIPFPNFAKLLKTWLEVLTAFSDEQRDEIFSNYLKVIIESPQKIISFNLDGVLEIFLSLDFSQKEIISKSIKSVISKYDENAKKKILLVIPDNAKNQLGF